MNFRIRTFVVLQPDRTRTYINKHSKSMLESTQTYGQYRSNRAPLKGCGPAWPLEWNTRLVAAPYCQSRARIQSPLWREPRDENFRYRATALAPGHDAAHTAPHSLRGNQHPNHSCQPRTGCILRSGGQADPAARVAQVYRPRRRFLPPNHGGRRGRKEAAWAHERRVRGCSNGLYL